MRSINAPSIILLFGCLSLINFYSCSSIPKNLVANTSQITDYNDLNNWAAHPEKNDKADLVPNGSTSEVEQQLEADVFFVHPTTYTSKTIEGAWNGPTTNKKLNETTDNGTIQFQASAFNQAGKVYAPRYQQAHIMAYYETDKTTAKKVFDIAFQDVKAAFEHYLSNYNNGRPFIIASHSQGTNHSERLISEMIDGTPLQKQLIAAYLIGMPIEKDTFQKVQPCRNQDDTECFISWRTFKKGFIPEDVVLGDKYAVHNPLSWTMENTPVSKTKNKGAILRNFDKVINHAADAEVHNGILWASKPKFAFSFLFTRKNYHIADINFYYMNVRENAVRRVKKYFGE